MKLSKPDIFVYERPSSGLVVVSGKDATTFLQSLVSQDLDSIVDGGGGRTLLLTPQGKLGYALSALKVGEKWWLYVDGEYGQALVDALTRYRIRVEVVIEDWSSNFAALELWGDEASELATRALQISVAERPFSHSRWGDQSLVVRVPQGAVGEAPERPTVFVIGPKAEVALAGEKIISAGANRATSEQFEYARIEAGIPLFGVDFDERTIAQEAFLERDGVSFTKGCFLGQELVCRIDSRGHVNRFIRRLVINGDSTPEKGSEVAFEGKLVGEVTSVAKSPDHEHSVALAMIRREVEPPTEVAVGISEIEATVLT